MLPTKGSKVGAQSGETGAVPGVRHVLKLLLLQKKRNIPLIALPYLDCLI